MSSRARASARRSRPGSYARRRWLGAGPGAPAAKASGQRRAEPDQRQDGEHDRRAGEDEGQPPAAGGKKTTRSASRGISEKSRTMVASCRVPSAGRDGGPHPEVELAAELLDQALLVLGHLGIALRQQHVAVARFHPDELHRLDYASGLRAADRLPRPKHVDRSGAGAELPQAVADRLGGDLSGPPRGFRRAQRPARGRQRGRPSGCTPIRAMPHPGSGARRSGSSPSRRRARRPPRPSARR